MKTVLSQERERERVERERKRLEKEERTANGGGEVMDVDGDEEDLPSCTAFFAWPPSYFAN